MNASNKNFSELSARELETIEGGVVAVFDENGELIADCLGRVVTTPGGSKIWVPHGTTIHFGG